MSGGLGGTLGLKCLQPQATCLVVLKARRGWMSGNLRARTCPLTKVRFGVIHDEQIMNSINPHAPNRRQLHVISNTYMTLIVDGSDPTKA